MALEIAVDDPRSDDIRELLAIHLALSQALTPPEYSFALDVDELAGDGVTFFSARRDGHLVGIAALKRLDAGYAELKSMHTRETERRRGIGRALVEHLVAFARGQGYRQLSLETGSTEDFVAARQLYAELGFRPCPPFGDYQASPYNTFLTRRLD